MNSSTFLVMLLQTSIVLSVALVGTFLARSIPALRLATCRAALLAVLGLVLALPWTQVRRAPVVPVDWAPRFDLVAAPVSHDAGPSPVSTEPTPPSTPGGTAFDVSAWLTSIWISGILILTVHLGIGYWVLARLRRTSYIVQDPHLNQILAEACQQAGVGQPRLLTGSHITAPFVAGVFRPAIFVPAGWSMEINQETVQAIFRHEVAHLANGDLKWGLFHRVACIALWPQPLLWWIVRPMLSASEELCDRQVLASGISSVRYAECLLTLRNRLADRPPFIHGIGAVSRLSSFGKRIEAILDARRSPSTSISRTASLLTKVGAVGIAVVAAFLFARPVVVPKAQVSPPPSSIIDPSAILIKVVDSNGKPVQGAKAWMQLTGEGQKSTKPLQVEGDKVILANQDLPPSAGKTLIVHAIGFGLGIKFFLPSSNIISEISLPKSATAMGQISLPNGQPAVGVKVNVKWVSRRLSSMTRNVPWPDTDSAYLDRIEGHGFTALTDSTGTYRIKDLPGDTRAWIDNEVGEAFARSFGEKPTADIRQFRLEPAAQISGVVMRDGNRMAGVKVEADLLGHGVWSEAFTDSDGRYQLKQLRYGVYNVAVDPEGPLQSDVTAVAHESVQLDVGQAISNLNFKLIPGAIIEGQVRNVYGDIPVANSSVAIQGPAHPRSGRTQEIRTDQDGRYRFRVPAGNQLLRLTDLHYGNFEKHEFSVVEGSKTTIDFIVRGPIKYGPPRGANP